MRIIAGPARIALATVISESKGLTAEDPFPWLDQSGLAALLASSFVVLNKFFTSYSHVDFPANASIAVNQQNGIPLFLAALAALVGEVKLASNNRCADQRDRNLYLVIDVWSRKVVAWDGAEREEAQIAADLLSRACLRERYCCAEGFAYSKGRRQPLILHADNGNAVAAGFREAIAGSYSGKPAGGAGGAQILL
jgi:transposase InsO family protein